MRRNDKTTQATRVLIVGVGSIGERHLRCMANTKRADVGICEPNPDLRDSIAERYSVAQVFEDLDAALACDQGWDAAVIATPAHTHIKLARQCIDAGLALMVEKPLAIDAAEAQGLVSAVADAKQAAVVAFVYRAHPALRAMREAITSERFGKPLQLIAVGGQNFPTYRPAYAQTYYRDHRTGGGAIQDAFTHVLNSCQWLVGPVTKIAVDAQHLALPDVEVEDTVHAMARHGDVMASYTLNQHQPANESSITVVCERGMARFDLLAHSWRWITQPDGPWESWQADFKERDDWFSAQEHAFLDVLEGDAEPLCTLDEGLQTLRATQAALASTQQDGAWVVV